VFAWLRPAGRPWRPHHKDLPALFAELELTAEQREKAKEIFDRHRATVESILKQNFPRVRATEAQTQRELRAILTETQNKKLDEIEARRPPGRRGRFGWKGGPPTPGGPGSREAGEMLASPPGSPDAGL
jgi:Spy/CpxP family protein refolding chaperone